MAGTSSASQDYSADIENNYTNISGGTWTALLNSDGVTVYSSGTAVISGPVNLWNAANLYIQSGAVVSGLTAVHSYPGGSGPRIFVSSGGVLESSYTANGRLTVSSGGKSIANTYEAETVFIRSGGSSSDDTFLKETFSAGSLATGTLNGSAFGVGTANRVITVSSGASISDADITNQKLLLLSGGVYNEISTPYSPPDLVNAAQVISGGVWTASLNSDGVTIYTSSQTSYSGIVDLWNVTTLNILSGAVVTGITAVHTYNGVGPTINVSSGGLIEDSYTANGYLNISSGGSSVNNIYESEITVIKNGGTSINDIYTESHLSGNNTSGTLNGSAFTAGDGRVSLLVSSGGTLTTPQVVNQQLTVNQGAVYTATSDDSCFLAGARVHTPSGLVLVEDLRAGDEIVTYVDGAEITSPLIWTGEARCVVNPYLSDDEAGYPVRILRGALAQGIPSEDLLITSEHCLFFENSFIPVRMLVNGRTIFYDKTVTTYAYYHIEVSNHAIIMVNGVKTESYLNTGSRRNFRVSEGIMRFKEKPHNWIDHAAAPLMVSRSFVEPVYRALEKRADDMGIIKKHTVDLVHDADLHLLSETGKILRPARKQGNFVSFMVPPGISKVRIISRTSRPFDTEGPYVDDRRQLGVLVGKIILLDAGKDRSINDHLMAEKLTGWDVIESQLYRWTQGDAVLYLNRSDVESLAMLSVEVVAAGPYLSSEISKRKYMMSCN